MQISKNGWLYKVAYRLSSHKPEVTNLCNFFWRTVFCLFVVWPIVGFFGLIGNIGAFFFASYYSPLEDRSYPYENWPTIKGRDVLPIYFVVAFFVGLLPYYGLSLLWSLALKFPREFTIFWTAFFITILAFALFMKFGHLELVKLLKEYLEAKKQKICPIIHFTE